MFEEDNAQWGLVHALVLDGKGGARSIARTALDALQLQPEESLWLHWDRSHPQTRTGCSRERPEHLRLRLAAGREHASASVALGQRADAFVLRGVNLNPGAEPEDMVSVRIFAEARRVISLRLRPLRASDEVLQQLDEGRGRSRPPSCCC